MYLFELENPHTGEKAEICVPEEMSIEDFTREMRCEMGLPYTVGTRYHMIIDQQNRVFMQDADVIATHVDMLWEGGDDPNDLEKKGPIYYEDYYFPEDQYTLRDLFPQPGANILYGQDYDKLYCTLKAIESESDDE